MPGCTTGRGFTNMKIANQARARARPVYFEAETET